MTRRDRYLLEQMRIAGEGPKAISDKLGISINTVKAYIYRHKATAEKLPCLNCGRPVLQNIGRKRKKYCSDKCRMDYWNAVKRERKKADGKVQAAEQ